MRCFHCQKEVESNEGTCPFCGQSVTEPEVRILTPEEKERYGGITIESDGEGFTGAQARRTGPGAGIYVRQIRLGGRSSWLTKAAFYLFLAAIAALLIFFLIPAALAAVGIGVLVWFILGFFR